MDFLFGQLKETAYVYKDGVSILVLADFLFGLFNGPRTVKSPLSFNPCFGGFSFRTGIFFGFVCVLKVFYRVFLFVCVIVVCLFDTL